VIFELRQVKNGIVLKVTVREDDEAVDEVVYQETFEDEIASFAEFLRFLCDEWGPSTSRHSPERIYIEVRPGDKTEDGFVRGKLVRDRIPEIIQESGRTPIVHTLDEDEFRTALLDKLQEEIDEYLLEDSPEELADVLEVVYTLAELDGTSQLKLEDMRHEKWQSRGRFKSRVFLDAVRVP